MLKIAFFCGDTLFYTQEVGKGCMMGETAVLALTSYLLLIDFAFFLC
jgi:hypothetical protein